MLTSSQRLVPSRKAVALDAICQSEGNPALICTSTHRYCHLRPRSLPTGSLVKDLRFAKISTKAFNPPTSDQPVENFRNTVPATAAFFATKSPRLTEAKTPATIPDLPHGLLSPAPENVTRSNPEQRYPGRYGVHIRSHAQSEADGHQCSCVL